jgi:hypothetical protein
MATPVPPAGVPTAPPLSSAGPSQNISSNELERNEIHEIASQLKQQLDSPQALATPKTAASSQPAKPAAQELPSTSEAIKKTEHLIDLKATEGDTIFIDRDGSFRQVKTTKTPSTQS